ncbi:DNA-binding protein [Halalkalibacter kiskunsagensis]|uniref:DNA-binding protein n=1 Tax=Halalkalibacter kiskunsagensis TaxID=1548599 RepID=A0ABV6KDU9_9BACI
MKESDAGRKTDLPTKLGKPARRALEGAGYLTLEQTSKSSEAELMQLHGIGPKALGQIWKALTAEGRSFFADASKK